jgi:hypothetical protein
MLGRTLLAARLLAGVIVMIDWEEGVVVAPSVEPADDLGAHDLSDPTTRIFSPGGGDV